MVHFSYISLKQNNKRFLHRVNPTVQGTLYISESGEEPTPLLLHAAVVGWWSCIGGLWGHTSILSLISSSFGSPHVCSFHIALCYFAMWRDSKPSLGCSPQMFSTKLPGKRPVFPLRCNVPLNQPSSRFLWTNTISPSFSSSSASLWGG